MPQQHCTLRNYQQEIVTRVHREWHHHRSVMVQMPTGTGKTHVLASIVSAFSGKILIVAHRVELIAQIKETLRKLRIEKEDLWVESIQTVSRRMDSLDFEPRLIIIDEAHHALAKTYRILWEKWPYAKFLGLTATPCRMNRAGFTDLFDTLVTSWSMAEFIRNGILSVFDYVSIRPNSAEQLLINSLQKRGADGDYQVKEMDAVLNKQPSIERLYGSILSFAKGKKGIVYAISIEHARRIAAYYNLQGITTVAIDSRTPKKERKRLVEAFKAGDIQVMVNVDVFSEGFDCPDVEFIQMARPTLSLAKYLQQVGRGLRKVQGKKTCILIDNVGLYRIFGLPVQAWDWEQMFHGALAGKGQREGTKREYAACLTVPARNDASSIDTGLEMVISHDCLLEKLHELDIRPTQEVKPTLLKGWQDTETGLWGLKRGKEKVTEASYITIFDIHKELAAVRFRNHVCGLVDDTGKIHWQQSNCLSLRFEKNNFLVITSEGNNETYLDLYNGMIYDAQPEIKRYGKFKLLKVRHLCYSRTQEAFVSNTDFENLLVSSRDFYLSIYEHSGNRYCILAEDNEACYSLFRRMEDESIVISDKKGNFYHAEKGKEKIYIGCNNTTKEWEKCLEKINQLKVNILKQLQMQKEEKKRKILSEHLKASPYQSGVKWGLKVGNRITIPPIYRNVRQPIGKYCAVEKNYSQWGIFSIDGTVLIEPKYPEVSIEKDGKALLTQVTGKKVRIVLK